LSSCPPQPPLRLALLTKIYIKVYFFNSKIKNFTISQTFTDTFGYLFANRVAPLGIRLFLRVRTDSPICFSKLVEHFTFCLSQMFFKLPQVFSVSCSDVLCFLFVHVWRFSAAHVPNVLYFRCTLFLDCSCFTFLLP
jgi:hypothetical protein